MDSLNPMFSKDQMKKGKTNNLSKTNNELVPRKKRSDAKNDVKIPLSLEQRQIIRQLAKRHHLSTTTYCSDLLGLFLRRNTEYPIVVYSPANKKSVHANLSASDYDLLFKYSIKWDCSLKQAAHRILTLAIQVESGGLHFEKF